MIRRPMTQHSKRLILVIICISLQACLAPRSNFNSGKVTPHRQFRVGTDQTLNVPLNTLKLAADQTATEFERAKNPDGNYERDTLYEYSRLALAQSLDPVGLSSQFYVRYGLIENLDLGVAYGSAGMIYDSAYQLLQHKKHGFDGSIGVQYSAQSYELPSVTGDIQELLGYTFDRSDLLARATLSLPFGVDEEYGAFGFGLALNYSSLSYGFEPSDIRYLEDGKSYIVSDVPQGKGSFISYGGFVNLKAGYRYAYAVVSLSAYYQDYGSYTLLDERSASFSGVTFVPSLGFQGAF